jgi:hypothetical protein
MTMANLNSGIPPDYNPSRLLDAIIENLELKNDAALSRALAVEAPVISKIRHGKLPIGGVMLIRMHEVSGLSIRELRSLMGDRREKFRLIPALFEPKEVRGNPEGD